MDTRVHNISGVREVYQGGAWHKMSPKEQAEYETAREVSPSESFGMNISRQYGRILESLPGVDKQDEGLLRQMNAENPGSALAGQMVGGAASSALPGNWWQQLGIGAIHGAATSPDDRLGGAIMGVAGTGAGQIATQVIGRSLNALRGIRSSNIPTQRAARPLADADYELTPGMRTGRQELKNTDIAMNKGGGAQPIGAMMERNQNRLNEQVADLIGITTDEGEITDAALRGFGREVRRVYSDVADSLGPVDLGQDLVDEIRAIPGVVNRLPKDGTVIEGRDLEKIRQSLSKRLKSPEWGDLAYDALEEVEDVYARELPENVAREFADIRGRYRVWKNLEKGQALTGGNVNPRSFNSNLVRNYGRLGERPPEVDNLIEVTEALKRYSIPEGSPTAQSMKGVGRQTAEGAVAEKYLRGEWMPNYGRAAEPLGAGTNAAGSAAGRGIFGPSDEYLYE